jgi:glucose-6-phosphate 1-epimerase
MSAMARPRAELHAGQPCWALTLPPGDSVRVAEHGAQVLSWVAAGIERLYLSPMSLFDGRSAIRGGVPVCWPQFSDRGPLRKHGWVRQQRWSVAEPAVEGGLDLTLASDPVSLAQWPNPFEATVSIRLAPGALRLALHIRNPGPAPLHCTGALHTYFAVDDVSQVEVTGLAGRPGWDALTGHTAPAAPVLRFQGEFDRVYAGPAGDITLAEGARRLTVRQGGGWTDTVVWNPAAAKCATLADMPAQGWRHMLCIEAARVFEPAVIEPGADWTGWQELSVA